MEADLDTFLVTLYCIVDDLYKEYIGPAKPQRRGKKVEMSDSEVLTLDLLEQWQEKRSESAFVDWVSRHWRCYFPRVLSQSAFNRRVRDLSGALAYLGPLIDQELRREMGVSSAYEALDSVPVPLMRCCRGRRHRLFADEAAIGRGGSDHEWYYGVQLLAAVSEAGTITGSVVGPAPTEERWLAEALMRWRWDSGALMPKVEELEEVLGPSYCGANSGRRKQRVGPTGPIGVQLGVGKQGQGPYVADAGFEGEAWARHWADHYGAVVLTRGEYEVLEPEEGRRCGHWLAGLRQVAERAFGSLLDVFNLAFPRARTYWGLLSRIAAKVAAFNISVYINRLWKRPAYSFINPLG